MKKSIQILIATLILFVLSMAALAQNPTRIKFRKGGTQKTVTGYLSSYRSKKVFVIRVRRGQTLKVSSNRYVTLTVLNPSGEDVMDRDASCNGRADISPTEAGDYRIEVVECQKADAWRGNFRLKVSVK
jgi:hypothetical protein